MAELCLAYRTKKPIIIIEGFDPIYDSLINNYADEGKFIKILGAKSPEEAVSKAIDFAKQNINKRGER